MKKISIALMTYLMISTTAYASYTQRAAVTLIQPRGDTGDVLVQLDAPKVNPDFCNGTFYYVLKVTNPAFDTIFSLLIAAQFNNTDIRLFISGCSGTGTNGFPVVLHADTV